MWRRTTVVPTLRVSTEYRFSRILSIGKVFFELLFVFFNLFRFFKEHLATFDYYRKRNEIFD